MSCVGVSVNNQERGSPEGNYNSTDVCYCGNPEREKDVEIIRQSSD